MEKISQEVIEEACSRVAAGQPMAAVSILRYYMGGILFAKRFVERHSTEAGLRSALLELYGGEVNSQLIFNGPLAVVQLKHPDVKRKELRKFFEGILETVTE